MSFVDNFNLRGEDFSFNPFVGSPTQTNRLKAACKVVVDGVDITSRLEPHLIQVRVVDDNMPSCELEIDDRDAKIPIPAANSPVSVSLGWTNESMRLVFEGQTFDLEHGGDKQQGRRMWVHARGANLLTDIKTPMQDSMGEGAPPGQKEGPMHGMQSWLSQVMGNGGGSISMHPAFAGKQRDFWSQSGESPMHHVQRMADEFGAVLQFGKGNHATFTKPGETTGGGPTETVLVRWSDNLIAWRVRPFASRNAWKGASSQSYDHQAANWLQTAAQSGLGGAFGNALATFGSGQGATQGNAEQNAGGDSDKASYEPGYGRIVFNGEPRCRWNGHILLQGVRGGVNGDYIVWKAEHIYSRQGYITWADVQINANAGENSVTVGYPLNPAPNIR